MSRNGIRKSYFTHRIVALAYIDNPENKPTVNHKNGIKSDNRVENLEWATWKEQKSHAIKNGLCDKNIEVLKTANKEKSRPVIFRNNHYQSINEAAKRTKEHSTTVVKEGYFL